MTTLASLHSLCRLNVRVALDEFGTDWSSLSDLRALPFDKTRIYRNFVSDLLNSDGATSIIKTITTLPEGVEDAGQLNIPRKQGCNQSQGFPFSKPVVEAEVERMLRTATREDIQLAS